MPLHSNDSEDEELINCKDVNLGDISIQGNDYHADIVYIGESDISLPVNIFNPIFQTDWIKLDECVLHNDFIDIPISSDTNDIGGLGKIVKHIYGLCDGSSFIFNNWISLPLCIERTNYPKELKFKCRIRLDRIKSYGKVENIFTVLEDIYVSTYDIRKVIDDSEDISIDTIDNIDEMDLMVSI